MAISIHHGPNGSYKTAGVVQDYLIPAIKEGRIVVTNIRGVDRDKCFDLVPDANPAFDVIYIDTDRVDGREQIARFWHWVPLGALLLFDEAGVLFPKRWRDSDLKKLDYPQGEEEGRPINWIEAWEMHRHYNWDIVLSCPNISSVRPDIRATSEGAYKHRNNKIIGFGGSYNEGFHKAEDNGSSASQFFTITRKKIKPPTFDLYQSTKTGIAQDSTAGTSIWKNGRLLVSLVVAVSALGYSGYQFAFGDAFAYGTEVTSQQISNELVPLPQVDHVSSDDSDRRVRVNSVANKSGNQAYDLEPFAGFVFKITAYVYSADRFLYVFNAYDGNSPFPITSDELLKAGYAVIPVSECAATIVYKTRRQNVTCEPLKKENARGA